MNRISKIQSLLSESSMNELLICDVMSIYYLIGIKFSVGERFIGLHIKKSGTPVLYLNELFPCSKCDDVEIYNFSDNDNIIAYISKQINGLEVGVDKNLVAKFLLPLIALKHDTKFVLGSILVDQMRIIKDASEINKMRAASTLNDKIMGEVEAFIQIGMCDKEIEAFIYDCYKKYNCNASFEPIVAFKQTASDPHASANGQILSDNDVCIIDMGCLLNDYCADMTRTFVFNYPEITKLYDIVLKANQAAEAMIKPGVRFCDVDKAARDIIEINGYGKYFTHRTGHGIGLEVHEPKDVSSVNEATICEGMCFSIEPGIYIEGLGGVRIEDLIVVSKDGCEVLNHYHK